MGAKWTVNHKDIGVTQDSEKFRVRKIDELLAAYIHPRNMWNSADEALFKPADLYRVPMEEAQDMQLIVTHLKEWYDI
jgi:hypothetical protein